MFPAAENNRINIDFYQIRLGSNQIVLDILQRFPEIWRIVDTYCNIRLLIVLIIVLRNGFNIMLRLRQYNNNN